MLTEKSFAAMPVVDDLGHVVGIFSESDAVRATMNAADGADHRSGEFADDAERSVVAALARTVAGVDAIDLRHSSGISLAP